MPQEKPPYEFLGRRTACSNARFRLHFDHLRDGADEVPEYLVVEPVVRSASGTTGVGVLPVVGDGVLLVRIYRHPCQAWGWEVPRGFVDPGEPSSFSALRELEEETGLTCAPEDLVSLGLVSQEPGVIAGRTEIFVASRCRQTGAAAAEIGLAAGRKFRWEELAPLIGTEELCDATTVATLYRWRAMTAAENGR